MESGRSKTDRQTDRDDGWEGLIMQLVSGKKCPGRQYE